MVRFRRKEPFNDASWLAAAQFDTFLPQHSTPESNRVVIFGDSYLNDLWILQGANGAGTLPWQQVITTVRRGRQVIAQMRRGLFPAAGVRLASKTAILVGLRYGTGDSSALPKYRC